MTKSPILAKDLNEKLLLENFGPGTFASAEEIAADEENDAKLWFDLIQSMEIWQNNKLIRDKRKRSALCTIFTIQLTSHISQL